METSTDNFELSESTVKVWTDSENGSDKSDELIFLGDENGTASVSTKDDFDNNLPDTVQLLKDEKNGSKVYLVGTAHFSKQSQEDVSLVIKNVQPHMVILELCKSRTSILALDEKTVMEEAKNIDMNKIMYTIRENGLYNGVMYLLLLNVSAHLTKEIGMAPGGEFRVAYREAAAIPNCWIHLGDRPIDITLKRALSRLTWFQTIKLAWHLLTSKDTVRIEDIEKCKNRDILEQLLADLAGEYPAFREVFLDERDIFLTNSLQIASSGKLKPDILPSSSKETLRIVGVVGIGHVPGIVKLWPKEQQEHIAEILTIPPPSLTSKVIRITYRVSLISLGGYLVYRYFPVPKLVKENFGNVVQRVLTSVKHN